MKKNYPKYLQSSTWKERRSNVLDKKGATCSICWSKKNINLHHNSYIDKKGKSNLGREKHKHLIPLCGSCHTKWHHYHGKRKITKLMIKRVHKMRRLGISLDDCIRFCFDKYLYKHIVINWKKDLNKEKRNKSDNSAIYAAESEGKKIIPANGKKVKQ